LNENNFDPATASGQLAALNLRFDGRDGYVFVGEIVDGLGRAGIGMTLLVVALPALIPIPGPIGVIFGTAITLLSLQLIMGARRLVLPHFVRVRGLPVSAVRSAIAKIIPVLRRIEHHMKPRRMLPLTGRIGRMALGLPLLLMGVAIALPAPLGNILPVASLICFALGLMMRDGVAVVIGLVIALFAMAWFALLFFFGAEVAQFIL
jgi:hypothetical protein